MIVCLFVPNKVATCSGCRPAFTQSQLRESPAEPWEQRRRASKKNGLTSSNFKPKDLFVEFIFVQIQARNNRKTKQNCVQQWLELIRIKSNKTKWKQLDVENWKKLISVNFPVVASNENECFIPNSFQWNTWVIVVFVAYPAMRRREIVRSCEHRHWI